jgi:flavin-binding protein dodecin
MSIVEIEVRGTSTNGFEDALLDAKRNAGFTCADYVDLDEVSRFVDIDGGNRRFGVTLKVTCLNRAS